MAAKTPAVAYSITVRAEYGNKVGMLSKMTAAIAEAGGDIGAIDIVSSSRDTMVRDVTINAIDERHSEDIVKKIRKLKDVRVIRVADQTFQRHLGGKIALQSRVPLRTRADLSMAYTPGVARVCMAIHEDVESVYSLTSKGNSVAVVSDGTAVLGLGDIGPEAGLPVMEGKCIIFKEFGGVDAWPIMLRTKDPDKIVEAVKLIAPTFGGINLEDISAPRCFYIEERLKKETDIPIFHDDQHGTACVVLAGLMNSLKIVGKQFKDLKVVIIGAGAAGVASLKLMQAVGVRDVVMFDTQGALHKGRDCGTNTMKKWVAENTNPRNIKGSIRDAMQGSDVFIGLSGPGVITLDHIKVMGKDPIVFAMSNPTPEILPEETEGYVRIMGTGRSDYPNQINNSLCFPGLFRGVLDVRAKDINIEMKIAAAKAIASCVAASNLNEEYVIPSMFDTAVARSVAKAVAQAAQKTGVAQRSSRRRQSSAIGGLQYTH